MNPELPEDFTLNDSEAAVQSPIAEPMQTGSCQAAFEAIRERTFGRLQELGADYVMTVKNLIQTSLASSLEINSLAKKHAMLIAKHFESCNCRLVNYTNNNAMLSFDELHQMLVRFDLDQSERSILSAEFLQPHKYFDQYSVVKDKLVLAKLQSLMLEPISDTQIVIPYTRVQANIKQIKQQLNERREVLYNEIYHRAFTAFKFEDGLSFYTLNFDENMTMLFWDRYTIVQSTAKSFYINQFCIVEHIISGTVEPERFIAQWKPSKNAMRDFLAERYACLTTLVRPNPTVEVSETEVPAVAPEVNTDDDNTWIAKDLLNQGIDITTVDPSNISDYDEIIAQYGSLEAFVEANCKDEPWTAAELLEQGVDLMTVDSSNISDYNDIIAEYGTLEEYVRQHQA